MKKLLETDDFTLGLTFFAIGTGLFLVGCYLAGGA